MARKRRSDILELAGPLHRFRIARVYEKLDDTDRARNWYERFTEDWKDADPDIPELIEARERLGELKAEEVSTR